MRRAQISWLLLAVVVSVVLVLGTVTRGMAQEQHRFSVQWKDITVADALMALRRQFGIQYVLPSDLGKKRIDANLTNATPVEAMRQILSAAQLTAVNENGVWHIRAMAQAPAGGRTYRPTATTRPATAPTAVAPPTPFRVGPQPVNVGGAYGTAQPSYGATPGATATGMTGFGQGMQQYSPEDFVFRIIPLKYIDPYTVLDMFGGQAVGGEGGGGGSRGSRGGYGGRGRDSYDSYDRDRYDRDRDRYDRDRDRYDRDD